MHTDVREIGTLQLASISAEGIDSHGTSNVLNKIHHLWRYSQLSNLWSIPTDCPQRERRGWMGLFYEIFYIFFPIEMYNSWVFTVK